MSTLSVTNISDGTNSTATTNVVKGSAKAWVNFDGTTNTGGNCDISGSYNVSTVTDSGTGQYTVNFTTAMEDANYCVCTSNNGSGSGGIPIHGVTSGSVTTTSVGVRTTNSSSFVDSSLVTVAVFR